MKTLISFAMVFLVSCGANSSGQPTNDAPIASPMSAPQKTAQEPTQDQTQTPNKVSVSTPPAATATAEVKAFKLTSSECTDPKPEDLKLGVTIMACNGQLISGTLVTDVATPTPTPTPTNTPDLTNLLPENVRSGVTIAGVTGNYTAVVPTATPTSNPTPDLTNLTAGNIKSGINIAGVVGTLVVESHSACDGNNQTGCVATATFRSADLTNLAAGNIRSGVAIAGVNGSVVTESHSPCSDNDQVGCTTTATYRSADLANLSAGNIKSGVNIAGTSGTYTGVAPTATDLRRGVSVNGTSGLLKTNCRNAISAGWDYNSNGTYDWYDSVDDQQMAGYGLPLQQASGWNSWFLCNSTDWTTTAEGHLKDNITNLTWHHASATASWTGALTACSSLNENGATWRLPTQKEVMQAYSHGMAHVYQTTYQIWTASTYSQNVNNAWVATIASGDMRPAAKTTGYYYTCVHE